MLNNDRKILFYLNARLLDRDIEVLETLHQTKLNERKLESVSVSYYKRKLIFLKICF